jgi:outer membrane protein assembly factor BamA
VSFSIYPALGYQPETRLQFGAVAFVVFKDPSQKNIEHHRPTSVSPYILFTQNKQFLTSIDIDAFLRNGWYLNIVPRYFNYPDFFFGIGNEVKPENVERYTNSFVRVEGRLLKPVTPNFFVGARFDVQHDHLFDFQAGEQLDTAFVTGEDGGYNAGLGPSLLFDTRDNVLYPTTGYFIRAEAAIYGKWLGGTYGYTSWLLDARRYVQLKNEKNVFAFQLAAYFTSGGEAPFYKLPQLGGDSRLRGIANSNLYIDRQSFWLQTEYRRDLFWRFGAVVFAGVGDVAHTISDYDARELKAVAGIGGRFQALKDEKLNIRADLGVTNNGQTAFYLAVREAF